MRSFLRFLLNNSVYFFLTPCLASSIYTQDPLENSFCPYSLAQIKWEQSGNSHRNLDDSVATSHP